jgi:hypothetical protein
MFIQQRRVLTDLGVTSAQWAILFSASYYLPVPPAQFVDMARLDCDEEIPQEELAEALDQCLERGWLGVSDEERAALGDLSGVESSELGVVLTEEGRELKNHISEALLETARI